MTRAGERERFEAWATERKLNLSKYGPNVVNAHGYIAGKTAMRWEAWQAATEGEVASTGTLHLRRDHQSVKLDNTDLLAHTYFDGVPAGWDGHRVVVAIRKVG